MISNAGEKNYRKQVLLFNLLFLLILLAISLFPDIPGLSGSSLKTISILSEVERDSGQVQGIERKGGPKRIVEKGDIVIKDYLVDSGFINAAGDRVALSGFLAKLQDIKKGNKRKVRIGYFGDSFIEGDLITQDLRQLLQDSYGGNGVGFMPVTSISAGFRQSIIHSFSDNWNDVSFKSDSRSSDNLYLSGHVYYPVAGSWVSYKGVNQPHLDSFTDMQVLFGKAKDDAPLDLTVNGHSYSFHSNGIFNTAVVPIGKTKDVNIADNSTTVPVFGVALESNTGITVDNFSFRGISGIELDNFHPDFLAQVAKERPYDLLIVHYGPNLLFRPNLVDFSWYSKKMIPTLKKLKTAFPNTSILLVSTADKGERYNGEWQSQKGVLPLIDVQYEIARQDKFDFFNLYNAMGGRNSMVSWVEQDPALANRDYTHVNFRGAKRIANLLFNAITSEFNALQKPGH